MNSFLKELDPVTLHNQALMNMESNPTEVLLFHTYINTYIRKYMVIMSLSTIVLALHLLQKENNYFI